MGLEYGDLRSRDSGVRDPRRAAVKIFIRTNQEWIAIPNKSVSLNSSLILEPDKNFDATKSVSLFLLPDLPDASVVSNVRVFVIGTLIEDGKETKEIASYVDLTLNP